MDGGFDEYYLLREHPDYTLMLGELGAREAVSLRHIRKALNYTFRLLQRDPQLFNQVGITEFGTLRVAKTEPYTVEDVLVPALQLKVHIIDDEMCVELISIHVRRDVGYLQ